MARLRRALLLLLALFVLAAFGAFVAERALRHSDPLVDDGFPPGLFVADATRGSALAPGFHAVVQRVHRFDLQVNESGYRDRPWSGEGKPAILMVGSSALFGEGVEAPARLSERLEARLGGAYRVLNAGVYGYGPPQARATIEKECARVAPKLVLYVHEYKLTRKDFLVSEGRTVVGGDLVNRGAPVAGKSEDSAPDSLWKLPRVRAWLWRHGLHPTQLVEAVRGRANLDPAYVARRYTFTADRSQFPEDGPARAAREIAGMRKAARECGAAFAVVVLPGPYEHRYAEEPATAELLRQLGGGTAVVDLRRVLADRPSLILEGLDYFDPPALDGFAAALAADLRKKALVQ